jgi:ABC-type transport system involved in multi-copper enzyme maturation permease subunit
MLRSIRRLACESALPTLSPLFMNVGPLIVRELRAEARRANTYWLRSLAAGLLTTVFVWSVWTLQTSGGLVGVLLFNALSDGLLLSLLVVVAGITADTISREKREGTLGLLFLTPLRSGDIVVGKALLHGLRAVSLFIAVAPIVGLPFLLGGITAHSLVNFALTLPATVMIAVASGILASIYSSEWVESIVWAELICAGFCAAFFAVEWILFVYVRSHYLGKVPKWISYWWLFVCIAALIYSAAALVWGVRFASRRLEATWQRESAESGSCWVRFFSDSTFGELLFIGTQRKPATAIPSRGCRNIIGPRA